MIEAVAIVLGSAIVACVLVAIWRRGKDYP